MPFIPRTIALYSFVIDVETGGLTYIDGRLAPGELPPTQKNSAIAGANRTPFGPAPGLPSR